MTIHIHIQILNRLRLHIRIGRVRVGVKEYNKLTALSFS